MIILVNGGYREIQAFTQSFDTIEDRVQYVALEHFYAIASQRKVNIPPKDLSIYEEYLSMTDDQLESLCKPKYCTTYKKKNQSSFYLICFHFLKPTRLDQPSPRSIRPLRTCCLRCSAPT